MAERGKNAHARRPQREADINGRQRQKRIDEDSCVVHALQSIAGCEAPADVFDERLKQLDTLRSPYEINRTSRATGVNPMILIEREKKKDQAAILDLIEKASEQKTPFGLRLSQYEPILMRITANELRDKIQFGIPFLALGKILYEGDKNWIGHASHIGLDGNHNFISLSDPLMEFTQPRTPNDIFTGIIFHPKQKAC